MHLLLFSKNINHIGIGIKWLMLRLFTKPEKKEIVSKILFMLENELCQDHGGFL